MLFSSWQFILLFLPLTVATYFALNAMGWHVAGQVFLVVASLFFYSYWNPEYLPLILASIFLNFAFGNALARLSEPSSRKAVLTAAIIANLAALGYYKYTDFLITNVNTIFGVAIAPMHIALPLAISFFTFTQIVYLIDSYRGETGHYNILRYMLFVLFFPHLIAGPIVQHKQIMPQFASPDTWLPRYSNLVRGLCLFAVGLFKKVVIADGFAIWADRGFDGGQALNFYEAWATSLSYTFQLYFDFSGYCDMAIGASLLFNIRLPINFNSPYKALDIQDFWRRWHITLSNFLRDYIYIPLGGGRVSSARIYLNIAVTFLLGGLWHGASWMFVIWGALHGGALIVCRIWKGAGLRLPTPFAWLVTFLFVNMAWVFFRARTMDDAIRVLSGMAEIRSMFYDDLAGTPTRDLAWAGRLADTLLVFLPTSIMGSLVPLSAVAAGFVLIGTRNAIELTRSLNSWHVLSYSLLFAISIQFVLAKPSIVFLYFNF